jgi:hypothetical protein
MAESSNAMTTDVPRSAQPVRSRAPTPLEISENQTYGIEILISVLLAVCLPDVEAIRIKVSQDPRAWCYSDASEVC